MKVLPAISFSILLAACILGATTAFATERALLVGIDKYDPPAPGIARSMPELYGPDNDTASIRDVLVRHFGFHYKSDSDTSEVLVLNDAQATRQQILDSLQRIIAISRRGDVIVFYFAGHGSYTPAAGGAGNDQTIVPVDAALGVPDIRSKTIARMLMDAVNKDVLVTGIFDSCYSGSIARSAQTGITRSAEPQNPDEILAQYRAEDAKDAQYNGPRPEDYGALILSAALSDQESNEEIDQTDGLYHGDFTMHLVDVLRSSGPRTPISVLFRRVQIRVQADFANQTPVMAGQSRFDKPVLGTDIASSPELYVTITGRKDITTFLIDAGSADGIYPGTTLKPASGAPVNPSTELTVTQVLGIDRSLATVQLADADIDVNSRPQFVVNKWTVPSQAMLRVYIPPAISTSSLRDFVSKISPFESDPAFPWLDDPTSVARNGGRMTVDWTGSIWESVSPTESTTPLGAGPTASAIAAAVQPETTQVFIDLPPTPELVAQIALGSSSPNNAVEVVRDPSEADYLLTGHLYAGRVEYAWQRRGTAAHVGLAPNFSGAMLSPAGSDANYLAEQMAPHSTWTPLLADETSAESVGLALTDDALVLARVKSWLLLEPPEDSQPFPYELALKNKVTGEYKDFNSSSIVHPGDHYSLVLKAVSALPLNIPQRYVYVFDIGSDDHATLFFPNDVGSQNNLFPSEDEPGSKEIVLPQTGVKIDATPGADTFILLTTNEPIEDTSVLSWVGVQSASRGGPTGDLLQDLLNNVGSTSRDASPLLSPDAWSLSRVTIETPTASGE